MTTWTTISPSSASWNPGLVDRNILLETGDILCTETPAPVQNTASWSATNLATGIIGLTNGGLTATINSSGGAGNNAYGRSDTSLGTGDKIYYEATINQDAGSSSGIGLCNASQTFPGATFYLGATANAIAYYSTGSVITNNGLVTSLAAFSTGAVVSCAVDVAHAKIWWRVNGGNWNNDVIANQNPATNTGGISIAGLGAVPLYPAYNLQYDGSNFGSMTVNFGATALGFAAPLGFTTFNSVPVTVIGFPLICETQGNPSQAVWTPVPPASGFM